MKLLINHLIDGQNLCRENWICFHLHASQLIRQVSTDNRLAAHAVMELLILSHFATAKTVGLCFLDG